LRSFLAVLVLGRRAFYRPTSILDERFTPIWAVSIAGVIATAIWLSFLAFRHIEFSNDLWWTFAMDANAPRILRATFLVVVLATAYLLLNVLQPARPEPGVADAKDLEHARRIIASSDLTVANAALSGDKRLLFSDDGDAFIMYQVAGRSWDRARRSHRPGRACGGAGVALSRAVRPPRRPHRVLSGER